MDALILAQSFGFSSILLILLPLAGSVMLAYGVYQVIFDLRKDDRSRVMSRLKRGSGGTSDSAKSFDPNEFRRTAAEATGMIAKIFTQWSFTKRFQTVLDQADLRWSAPHVLTNLFAVSSITTAALLLFGLSLVASLGTGAACFFLPIMYLYKKRNARLKKLVEQLPDVFELLSQALRAGHSLASGMQLVSKEVPAPAGTEFGRVFHEQNLGLKVEDALRNLADRTDILDVRFFVTAVLIQRQTGGDLAEVLDNIGSVIADRIKLFGTVQALTAEGRLSGYVLLALPPLVLSVMMVINREYAMTLFVDPIGKIMLTSAITSQFMGWLMIKKIVNIKV